jgi:hypothetical protein
MIQFVKLPPNALGSWVRRLYWVVMDGEDLGAVDLSEFGWGHTNYKSSAGHWTTRREAVADLVRDRRWAT